MAIDKVKAYYKQWDMEYKIQEFQVSSATVELAALALGCEEARIAKSLSFQVKDRIVLVVTAGDAKVDNAKFKSMFQTKAKMLAFDEVEKYIGHEVGGVCPFAIHDNVEVYLDISLKRLIRYFLLAVVVIVQLNLLFRN